MSEAYTNSPLIPLSTDPNDLSVLIPRLFPSLALYYLLYLKYLIKINHVLVSLPGGICAEKFAINSETNKQRIISTPDRSDKSEKWQQHHTSWSTSLSHSSYSVENSHRTKSIGVEPNNGAVRVVTIFTCEESLKRPN